MICIRIGSSRNGIVLRDCILDKSEIKGEVKGYVFNFKHNIFDTCDNCYGSLPSFRPQQPYNPNHKNTHFISFVNKGSY